jgi:AcrR family transcriptional regulator
MAEILAGARKILREDGIGALSMARLAEVTGFSRPTVYKYFPTKEEVIVALGIEVSHIRRALTKRVEAFDARPRERMMALGELSVVLFPELFSLELLAYAKNVREQASQEAQARMRELELYPYRAGLAIVEDAVAAGDLVLDRETSPGEVLFVLSGMVNGILGAVGTILPMQEFGVEEPIAPMHRFARRALDSLGWRPLSNEWDYRATMRRIYEEVFPPELRWQVASHAASTPED